VNPSDESIVEDVLGGRLDAFDELMKRYERIVFKVAWGFSRDRQDALDITQQVFLKAYKSLRAFRRDANLKTWLMRIAYNESVSWLRQSGRAVDRHELLEDEHAQPGTQEQQLLAREQEAMVERELGKLNDRYRLAINLRYRQGLPIEEIAAVLQCSEGTTKSMLFRGVRALRQALGAAG
jgi:RNA polymerase sigma-70 factor (ECF subfamily)